MSEGSMSDDLAKLVAATGSERTGKSQFQSKLLVMTLQVAVPLRIMRIKERGGPTSADFEAVANISQQLAERGDVLLFGGGKKDEVANLFNGLAETIALLAFSPGGIHLFGQHWEARRHLKRATPR